MMQALVYLTIQAAAENGYTKGFDYGNETNTLPEAGQSSNLY